MRNADEKFQAAEDGVTMSNRFFLLLILGFVLVFAGILIILVAAMLYEGGSANFGAVIFIGPFPIVVGAGSDAALMVLFGIILAVLVIMFLVMSRRIEGSGG